MQELKNILIVAHAMQRQFLPQLAEALKARFNANIHLVCTGPVQREFYEKTGAFDSLHIVDRDRHDDGSMNTQEVFAAAQRWETRLGTTINSILMTDRHFGRGFALAGYGHPRSQYSERTSLEDVVSIYTGRIEFWDQLVKIHNIDLIVNGPRELVELARLHEIPFRWMVRARFGNYYYWAFDDRPLNPAIEARFHELEDGVDAPQQQDQPLSYERGRRNFEEMHRSFPRLLRNLARRVALHVYWHIKKSEKAKGYALGEELRYLIRAWRGNRWLLSGRFTRLADLQGKRFVYFPLQQEPEASTLGWSREYFFQHATIAQIARDLPAGVMLAVKETFFAAGRRPADFYDQIQDFKNVIFLDARDPGLEVIKQAEVTVSIAGSAGHEAAVMGKPVITFCRANHFNFLPHVTVIHDGATLREPLHAYLRGDYDAEQAARDGDRLMRALHDVSFDMQDFDYVAAGKPRPELVHSACDSLIESLQWQRLDPSQFTGVGTAAHPFTKDAVT
jgi:hypothetical protein